MVAAAALAFLLPLAAAVIGATLIQSGAVQQVAGGAAGFAVGVLAAWALMRLWRRPAGIAS